MKSQKEVVTRRPSESDLARGVVIQVTLMNGDPYTFNLHDVCWIDLEDIHSEVAGQSQRYAFYSMLHVNIKDELRTTRNALAQFLVDQDEGVRESAGKGATETLIKNTIKAMPGYRSIEARVEKLEQAESRIGVVRESLTQRRDMLQSACMLRAPEGGGNPGERAARTYRPK